MSEHFRHPVVVLAVLGAISGALGSVFVGSNFGAAPHPGIYMVLIGVWFGLVIGFAVWCWVDRSWRAVVTAALAAWVGWQLAVNVAMQIDTSWYGASPLFDASKDYLEGLAAGAIGALATWAGVAAFTPMLRRGPQAAMIIVTGALFGLLLPLTNHYDSGAILLLPWQAAVAAMIGFAIAPVRLRSKPLQQ
jgi:hypothetical protein